MFGGGVNSQLLPIVTNDPYNFPTIAGDNDGYWSGRLAYARPSWALGFNWLQDGVHKEQGWSADLAAQIWGRDVRVEYAKQRKNFAGADPGDDDAAIMASADIWRGTNWRLTGFYSDVDPEYDVVYSIMHPYYETLDRFQPAGSVPWEKWLRNPLVLNNRRVLGGHLDFMVGSMPFTVAYFDIDANTGADPLWDTLWAVSTSKQLADGQDRKSVV